MEEMVLLLPHRLGDLLVRLTVFCFFLCNLFFVPGHKTRSFIQDVTVPSSKSVKRPLEALSSSEDDGSSVDYPMAPVSKRRRVVVSPEDSDAEVVPASSTTTSPIDLAESMPETSSNVEASATSQVVPPSRSLRDFGVQAPSPMILPNLSSSREFFLLF